MSFCKIGLELFSAEGPAAVEAIRQRHKRVFLDLKLHDIPRTVARAVEAAARHGIELLTVHASGGREMMQAARDAAGKFGPARPRLVAVTLLTSLDREDLAAIGVAREPPDHVLALAELAMTSGMDGVVCSPREVALLRRTLGTQPILVVPGIRPAAAERGDQKRTATPAEAARDGATYIVVGRPILDAPDPARAARQILDELKRHSA